MTKRSRPQATAQTDAARYMPVARPSAVRDSRPATPSAAPDATVKVTNKNQRPTNLYVARPVRGTLT